MISKTKQNRNKHTVKIDPNFEANIATPADHLFKLIQPVSNNVGFSLCLNGPKPDWNSDMSKAGILDLLEIVISEESLQMAVYCRFSLCMVLVLSKCPFVYDSWISCLIED